MDNTFIVTLEKEVYGGLGMGRLPDGRAVFVPGSMASETVRLRLTQEAKRHAHAELLEVITPAAERISPRCPHFGKCGGCHYQHMPYARQLALKEAIVRDQLERIGKITNPPVRPIVPAPQEWHYRNHVQFHQSPDGRLGFVQAAGDAVLPIETCFLPEAPIADFWPQIELEPSAGLERIGLRVDSYGDLMLTLYGNPEEIPAISSEAGIAIAHVDENGDAVILAGDDAQVFHVLGRDFRVSPGAFFQVHTAMAEKMVQHLLEIVTLPVDTIFDVYCGGGLFSAFLAPHCRQLIGIETAPAACEDFAINLDEFDHVALYEAPAEIVLPALEMRADLIVVDPPRAGLHPDALDAIVRTAAREIAYVSCDPATFARDAARLIRQGYELIHTTPFDLFPQTYHIETVSLFRRSRP